MDGDAFRVAVAGKLWGVIAPFDIGDLRRSEGHNLIRWIVPEVSVEIMEIATRGAHDDNALSFHVLRFSLLFLMVF